MSGTRRCSNCGQPEPVELEMKVQSGQTLTMLSCSRCEFRTWLSDGEPVDMEDVLKLTSGDPDFVVRPAATRRRRVAGR